MDDFDPYLQWFGIGPHERPIDHYRLLGLPRFEPSSAAIAAAADQRMTQVRSFQTGPRGTYTQRLLNELATARVCLLNPQTKTTYDDFLRGLAAAHSATPSSPGDVTGTAATGGESHALPPSVGPAGPWTSGVGSAPLAGAAASAPYASPLGSYGPAPFAGAPFVQPGAPGAIPMATPVAYFPGGLPPQAYPASAAPVAYAPVAMPSAVPPAAPPPISAPPPPPPPSSGPPPVSRGKPPATRSTATTSTATSSTDSPADVPAEELEPLVTRRWFPLAVLAAVALVAGIVWGVGRALRSPPPGDLETAAVDDEPTDDPPEGEEPSATPKKKIKPSEEYPGEAILSQEGNGDVNFPASVARLQGASLTLDVEGPDPVISGWTGDDDAVSWDFRLVKADIFRVEITYAASADWSGGEFTASVGDAEKSGEVLSSGGVGTFRTDKIFLPVKRTGKHVLTIRTSKRPGEQLWVLKSVRFIPQGVAGK